MANATLMKVPVGQEAELNWGHWTLDGIVHHVDNQAPADETIECCFEHFGPMQGVEVMHRVHRNRIGQPLGFIGRQHGARGHDQYVVGNLFAIA